MTGQFFVKFSNNKFHENPSSFSRVVTFVQTDEQSDFNLRLARIRMRLNITSYLVKIPRLHYKDQAVNSVDRNNRFLL